MDGFLTGATVIASAAGIATGITLIATGHPAGGWSALVGGISMLVGLIAVAAPDVTPLPDGCRFGCHTASARPPAPASDGANERKG